MFKRNTIMKKTYIAPETFSIKVSTQSMIATSTRGITFGSNGTGSVEVQNGNATGTAMGRDGSDWDDED